MRLRVEPQEKKNYTIITIGDMYICYSYETPIAMKYKNQIYIDEGSYDYSNTTGKHRKDFLREGLDDTRKKMKNGTYKVVDLEKFIESNFIIEEV